MQAGCFANLTPSRSGGDGDGDGDGDGTPPSVEAVQQQKRGKIIGCCSPLKHLNFDGGCSRLLCILYLYVDVEIQNANNLSREIS